MKKPQRPRRAGDARIHFFTFGMPRDTRKVEQQTRKTRREQLAELTKMQKTPSCAGDDVPFDRARLDGIARRNGMRPMKPPAHDFGERRSTAAEREAARYASKQVPPEIDYNGTSLSMPMRERGRRE